MSNKPDSTAAEQYLQERFPTLIGQEQVAIIMTEFAQKGKESEAQQLLKWVSEHIFLSDCDTTFYFKEDKEGDNPMNEEEVLNAFKRYKEGKG